MTPLTQSGDGLSFLIGSPRGITDLGPALRLLVRSTSLSSGVDISLLYSPVVYRLIQCSWMRCVGQLLSLESCRQCRRSRGIEDLLHQCLWSYLYLYYHHLDNTDSLGVAEDVVDIKSNREVPFEGDITSTCCCKTWCVRICR